MTGISISTDVRRKSELGGGATTTLLWMAAAFLIAFTCAAAVLAFFGLGERGTAIALRVTARWSFLLFWLAYTGSAMGKLFGSRFVGLARRGRDFGLAFASAQAVHVGLVLWLFYLAPGSNGGMVFFWVGILCTYVLALISLPQVHGTLGPGLWLTLRTVGIEYIALVFAADFILIPLQANGFGKYPLTYLPFALLLIGGVGLRVTAYARLCGNNSYLGSKITY
jgi:hypothetical protein